MSQNLRAYVQAAYTVDAVVRRVPDDTWGKQSPCTDWTAGEVLGHVIWGVRRITADAAGRHSPAEQPEAEIVGDDPAGAWDAALDDALVALDQPGALARMVDGPFGTMPIDDILGFVPSDLLAHAWDIARTAGMDAHLPDDLCARYAEGIAAAGDGVRGPGMMAAAVQVADDADPVARFVAQTGRRP